MLILPMPIISELPTDMISQPFSYIRVLHASPKSPNVDVYANDRLIASNVAYRRFTEYFRVPAVTTNIKIYPAGQRTNPVTSRDIVLQAGRIYTVAAIGVIPNVEVISIPDIKIPVQPGRANIRFVNLSPNLRSSDLYLRNGTVLASNIAYRGISPYRSIRPGRQDLYVRVTGTNEPVLYVPNANFRPGVNYSAYLIGLMNEAPTLQMLLPMDGSTYIRT